jgi:hypothetical protein
MGAIEHIGISIRRRGKERQAHHEDERVLGETAGGPDRPDFAGDLTGRRGPCLLF